MNRPERMRTAQAILAFAAAAFGAATITAGVRVLAGSDPGYIVFRPLLLYNTAMGIAYIAAGVLIWRGVGQGMYAAAVVFVLNFLVLGATGILYAIGSAVAVESFGAMSLRTVVWLVLYLLLKRMNRRSKTG